MHALEQPVVIEGHRDVGRLVPRPSGRHQVLATVLDPLHGSRQLRGGEHDAHLLALHEDLLAEPTAGVPGDGPDPVLRDAEQPGAEGAMFVWRLGRDPHRHLVGAALVLDDDAAGLDRHRGVGLLVDGHFDDVGRRPEDLLEHRRRSAVVVDDVAPVRLVHQHVGVGRGEVVDHRRQGVDVDDHELAGVLGDVAVLGDDERDGIADEADLPLGQRRSRRLRRRRAELGVPLLVHIRVEVLGDEHRLDARQGQGFGHVDGDDPAPGDVAAHEAGVEHARSYDVVDEGAAPPQESFVLHPVHPAPGVAGEARLRAGHDLRSSSPRPASLPRTSRARRRGRRPRRPRAPSWRRGPRRWRRRCGWPSRGST